MGRRLTLLGIALVGSLLGVGRPGLADCDGPEMSTSTHRVGPGEEISIAGQGWMDGCDDNGSSGGCGSQHEAVDSVEIRILGPISQEMKKRLRVGGVIYSGKFHPTLVVAHPDDDGDFEVTALIPNLPDGTYVVTPEIYLYSIIQVRSADA